MTLVIPDSISNKEHVAKLDELADKRFEDLNLSVLLVYLINTVPASALQFLGEQFDVMGYKGWKYATTEAKKRDLIKRAIELHRFKGTPWSIKEALRVIGVTPSIVEEGVSIFYNALITHNGGQTYGGGHWANFRVLIPDGAAPVIDSALMYEIRQLILEYKNARSHLTDVLVSKTADESITIVEEFIMSINFDMVDEVGRPVYDAKFNYNGVINHRDYEDVLNYTVSP